MIYLISNCTNSKKIIPNQDLLIANYQYNNIYNSISIWENNKKLSISKSYLAKELYKGHSWQETLKSIDILSNYYNTKLLISSAGYGLIDSMEKINSYQATFAKGNENSIYNFKNNLIKVPTVIWWDAINKFDLSTLNKKAYIFISVSYEYLIAMQNTIKILIEIFGDKLFIIILSKDKLPEIWNKNILRFDNRFNSYERGTINSIIPRFTKWLFKEIVTKNLELDNKKLQKHINDFLSNFSKYEVISGKQLTDKELLDLILEQIEFSNISSKSKGLKDLRFRGYACSQERYGKLYIKVKGN